MEEYYSNNRNVFDINDIYLNSHAPKTDFHLIDNKEKMNISWEERGRCLSILMFLMSAVDEDKEYNVIYIDAFPDNHVLFLSALFSKLTWNIYNTQTNIDLDELSTEYSKNINININIGTFSLYDFNKYRNKDTNNTILISSMKPKSQDGLEETEIRNFEIMKYQKELVNYIQPKNSLLRFAPPHHPSITGRYMDYMDGEILIIPYMGSRNYENWLVPEGGEVNWNLNDYWSRMKWHNTIRRKYMKYSEELEVMDVPEIKSDYVSAYEIFALSSFLEKNKVDVNPERIIGLSHYLTKMLDETKSLNGLRENKY